MPEEATLPLPTAPQVVRLATESGAPLPIVQLAAVSSVLDDFLYVGKGLTADEFTDYVNAYNFGTRPPDYVVLHHTEVPGTVHAKQGGWIWDAGESGKTAEQVYRQRRKRLASIRDFYRGKGWDRGPHLFIDDRYIWLFSPMRQTGKHAGEGGNGFKDASQRLHYSIGIEVVGNYTNTTWPPAVERMVGHAVAVLQKRLGTFQLEYRAAAPKHTASGRVGSVCSHRDFNKPSCPGNAIGEEYYMGVLQREWNRLFGGAPSLAADSPVAGPASGSRAGVEAYVRQRLPAGSEYAGDVGTIVGAYWRHAPGVGVDPFLAAAQMVMETDGLRSPGAARPHRNPARLGEMEGGAPLSFATWDAAVQAHVGRLLAVALGNAQATQAQREMMARYPRHGAVSPALRGAAATVRGLGAAWGGAPGYGGRLVERAAEIG